jgi:hypothetical protein
MEFVKLIKRQIAEEKFLYLLIIDVSIEVKKFKNTVRKMV